MYVLQGEKKMCRLTGAQTWGLWSTILMLFWISYPNDTVTISPCQLRFVQNLQILTKPAEGNFHALDTVLDPQWAIKCHRVRKMCNQSKAQTWNLLNTIPMLYRALSPSDSTDTVTLCLLWLHMPFILFSQGTAQINSYQKQCQALRQRQGPILTPYLKDWLCWEST